LNAAIVRKSTPRSSNDSTDRVLLIASRSTDPHPVSSVAPSSSSVVDIVERADASAYAATA
jgi:hypothetical protein